MDETSQQPSICVDIDSLYDGSYNGAYTPSTTAAVGEELSLFVRMDKEICPVLSADSPLGGSSRPLDLQHVDFLGSVDVVKKLFSMPYTDQRPLFAFHRMGNTLLLDCVTGNDKNPYDITFPVDSENTKYQHSSHLDTTSVGWSSPTSSIASTGDKLGSLHFADSSFDSLDHLITSSSIESILGKVTPLYLPAPTKSLRPDFSVGLLTNEESVQNQTDSLRDATNVGRPERRTGTGSLVSSGGNRETADISNPVGGIDVDVDVQSGIESSGLEELKRELSIASGSPFLPPPNYFMPSVPPPAK